MIVPGDNDLQQGGRVVHFFFGKLHQPLKHARHLESSFIHPYKTAQHKLYINIDTMIYCSGTAIYMSIAVYLYCMILYYIISYWATLPGPNQSESAYDTGQGKKKKKKGINRAGRKITKK